LSFPSGWAIEVRRLYADPDGRPGEYRVLVDRLWPRGVSKDALAFDEWAKDLAPSPELRRWYGHDPGRFDGFKARYLDELRSEPRFGAFSHVLKAGSARSSLVLLTATRDVERSGASVLATYLRRRRPG
jgi:uncharacterized protein YeaO (DUF488 family)